MKAGSNTLSTIMPPNLSMKRLFGDLFELEANADIKEVIIKHEDEEEVQFEYVHFEYQSHIKTYDEAVSSLVGLKYSTGDEIALMRKGIAEPQSEEYTDYTTYVENCKTYAKQVWNEINC